MEQEKQSCGDSCCKSGKNKNRGMCDMGRGVYRLGLLTIHQVCFKLILNNA
jgi:hypothetical protein